MEKQILKVLKDCEICNCDSMKKFAVVSFTESGTNAYVLLKMFSLNKMNLNDENVEVKDKQWKYFFPMVIKASEDSAYIFGLYADLTSC